MDKNRKQKLDVVDKREIIQSKTEKTLIERAKREVPGFSSHYLKFEEQMTIGGYSQSTLFSYSRAVAKVSLYFKKSLLDLDADEVNSFLFAIAKEKKASSTFFKHTVYGVTSFIS